MAGPLFWSVNQKSSVEAQGIPGCQSSAGLVSCTTASGLGGLAAPLTKKESGA